MLLDEDLLCTPLTHMHAAEQPVSTIDSIGEDERIDSIDVARGAALFGVLLVNLETDFRLPLMRAAMQFHTDPGVLNHTVDWILEVGIAGKAFSIFSLLFGVGLAVQDERAKVRGRGRGHLVRRLAVLLAIGVLHLALLWDGDILALYAVAGLIALPFLRRSSKSIGMAIGIIVAMSSYPYRSGSPLHAPPGVELAIARALAIYGQGGYLDIVAFRVQETLLERLPLYMMQLPRTVGLLLVGVLAWRSGIVQRPREHRALLWAVLWGGGTVGLAGTVLHTLAMSSVIDLGRTLNPVIATSLVPLALAYLAALLLFLVRKPARATLGWLAAAGRMALTNYLLQSLVLGFVFYGYGFELFGRLTSAQALPIGITLYTLQIAASAAWLRRFRFGPAEWIWRSATYGRWQSWSRTA